MLNPAASVKGVKETVLVCETPEITLEQGRTQLASTRVAKPVKDGQEWQRGKAAGGGPA
jgi:hypothetical protein